MACRRGLEVADSYPATRNCAKLERIMRKSVLKSPFLKRPIVLPECMQVDAYSKFRIAVRA